MVTEGYLGIIQVPRILPQEWRITWERGKMKWELVVVARVYTDCASEVSIICNLLVLASFYDDGIGYFT